MILCAQKISSLDIFSMYCPTITQDHDHWVTMITHYQYERKKQHKIVGCHLESMQYFFWRCAVIKRIRVIKKTWKVMRQLLFFLLLNSATQIPPVLPFTEKCNLRDIWSTKITPYPCETHPYMCNICVPRAQRSSQIKWCILTNENAFEHLKE